MQVLTTAPPSLLIFPTGELRPHMPGWSYSQAESAEMGSDLGRSRCDETSSSGLSTSSRSGVSSMAQSGVSSMAQSQAPPLAPPTSAQHGVCFFYFRR